MKLRDAQKDLQKHGMVLKKTGYGNEHRVNYKGGKEETAYYSDDLHDAHSTGHHMAREKGGMKEHEHPRWDNKK